LESGRRKSFKVANNVQNDLSKDNKHSMRAEDGEKEKCDE
jgi:hypothetical protein